MTPTLLAHDIRRIAVEAIVDPRTVERYLANEKLKSTTRERIRQALDRLGIEVAA